MRSPDHRERTPGFPVGFGSLGVFDRARARAVRIPKANEAAHIDFLSGRIEDVAGLGRGNRNSKRWGRTIEVDSRKRMEDYTPHVHYRWFDATGEIDTDAATEGYTLMLSLGEPMNGLLPGTIEFAVPGEDTRVGGAFVAALR